MNERCFYTVEIMSTHIAKDIQQKILWADHFVVV